jgi:hypothetical protein
MRKEGLNKRELKQRDKQVIKAIRILELNVRKLANLADDSLNLRDLVFPESLKNDGLSAPISAAIKGIINETRANKLSFNESIRTV